MVGVPGVQGHTKAFADLYGCFGVWFLEKIIFNCRLKMDFVNVCPLGTLVVIQRAEHVYHGLFCFKGTPLLAIASRSQRMRPVEKIPITDENVPQKKDFYDR